jgi:hypothetical protein
MDIKKLGVIIPVYNDIQACEILVKQLSQSSLHLVVVVVFCQTEFNLNHLDNSDKMKLFCHYSGKGRALQINAGASVAIKQGASALWFLHADSILNQNVFLTLHDFLSSPNQNGGCFQFSLPNSRGFWPRLYEKMVYIRSKLGLAYGDQGFFVRVDLWNNLGPFLEWPLLEDVEWWRRYQKSKYPRLKVFNTPLGTSARRFEKRGWFKSAVKNLTIIFAYFCGISPSKLKTFYN